MFTTKTGKPLSLEWKAYSAFNKGGTATNVRPFWEELFLCSKIEEEETCQKKIS
ncbi:hypothetical protein JCM19047_919 [Bacillus sp. JCM 19047]|nr:hypothetical protein JCM19047_919 [Bacillus sp. JCM 19047]